MKRKGRDEDEHENQDTVRDTSPSYRKRASPNQPLHGKPSQGTDPYLNIPRQPLSPNLAEQSLWVQRLIKARPEDAWTDNARGISLSHELEDGDPEGNAAFLKGLDTYIVHDYAPSPRLVPSDALNPTESVGLRTLLSAMDEVDLNRPPRTTECKNDLVAGDGKNAKDREPPEEIAVPNKAQELLSVEASARPTFEGIEAPVAEHSFKDQHPGSHAASLLAIGTLRDSTPRHKPIYKEQHHKATRTLSRAQSLVQPPNFSPWQESFSASRSKRKQESAHQTDMKHKRAQYCVGLVTKAYGDSQHGPEEQFRSSVPWTQPQQHELQYPKDVKGYLPTLPMPSLAPQNNHASISLSAYPDPRDHALVPDQNPTEQLPMVLDDADVSNDHNDYFSFFNNLRRQNVALPCDEGGIRNQGNCGGARGRREVIAWPQLIDNEKQSPGKDRPPTTQDLAPQMQIDVPSSSIPIEPDWSRLGPGGLGNWPSEWIKLQRGRVDGQYPAHYPKGDIRLAGGHPLEAYCYYRPNHVWGDGLRPFINDSGWAGLRVWSSFAQDVRDEYRQADGTFGKRAQNWIQQAWCREKKLVRQEKERRQHHRAAAVDAESSPERARRRLRAQHSFPGPNAGRRVTRRMRATRISTALESNSGLKPKTNCNSTSEDIELPQHSPDAQGQYTSADSLKSQQTSLSEPWWGPVLRHHINRLMRQHQQRDPSFAQRPQQDQRHAVIDALRRQFDAFAQTYWHGIPSMLYSSHPMNALRAVYRQLLQYDRVHQATTEEQFCNSWMQTYLNFIDESLNRLERELRGLYTGSIPPVQRHMHYGSHGHAGLHASSDLGPPIIIAASLHKAPLSSLSSMQQVVAPYLPHQSQLDTTGLPFEQDAFPSALLDVNAREASNLDITTSCSTGQPGLLNLTLTRPLFNGFTINSRLEDTPRQTDADGSSSQRQAHDTRGRAPRL